MDINLNYSSIQQRPTATIIKDKPAEQMRQRKKSKTSHSQGENPEGSDNAHLSGITDSNDDFLLPPVLQPLAKKTTAVKQKVSVAKVEEESSLAVCLQVLFPYLLAGMGMVMAGMVLQHVQVSTSVATFEIVD